MVRLEVNVSDETAQMFRAVIGRKNISITEGVRRAIGVWCYVEGVVASGSTLAEIAPDGTVTRIKLADEED